MKANEIIHNAIETLTHLLEGGGIEERLAEAKEENSFENMEKAWKAGLLSLANASWCWTVLGQQWEIEEVAEEIQELLETLEENEIHEAAIITKAKVWLAEAECR